MTNPVRFLLHVPVPWVFVLTYLLGVALEHVLPRTISPTAASISTIAGAVLFAVGAVIAGWGLVLFRKAKTTTVPGKLSGKLVTWGPYRFTRNPMYVGLVLAYLGEAGLMKQIWPVVFLPLTIAYLNWTVIPLEEVKLDEAFHDEFGQYRLLVRRWF
jgi:protein-S-isoprenylcysteine O-methyltransferase Ste14